MFTKHTKSKCIKEICKFSFYFSQYQQSMLQSNSYKSLSIYKIQNLQKAPLCKKQLLQSCKSIANNFLFQQQNFSFSSSTQKKPTLNSQHKYVRGFRNTHALEYKSGYLPHYTNPKIPPHNMITEQFTGPQGFTGEASCGGPLKLWFYKKTRSINVGVYSESQHQTLKNVQFKPSGPNPQRFKAPPIPQQPTNFVSGLHPFAENDHIYHYQYNFNKSMSDENLVYHNADGELLIQPSCGNLTILTECGILELFPGVIGVIPKNMKFQVNLTDKNTKQALGIVTELKNDRSFRLSSKGPIGANGLANSEYFESPTPYVDEQNLEKTHKVICKMQNINYEASHSGSPFDVYAWKGNYAPYRFDLEDFVPIIAGQRDHIDPSSHIVLSVSGADGANFVELVAFVSRFNVSSGKYPTYLPPYDHRNNGKAEIMHYLGGYDARVGSSAGMQTLHNQGQAHGNDAETFNKSRSQPDSVAIELNFPPATMLEITNSLQLSDYAFKLVDDSYISQLHGTGKTTGEKRPPESYIGDFNTIQMTAFNQSMVPTFDILMPEPEVVINDKLGHQQRIYSNKKGQIIKIDSQLDQNNFWEIYRLQENSIPDQFKAKDRDPKSVSDEELKACYSTMKNFFNRGTVVDKLVFEVKDPQKTHQYFIQKGIRQGREEHSLTFEDSTPLIFKLVPEKLASQKKNSKSRIHGIDHTVINTYKKHLNTIFTLLPDEFWGGDPRDLRATGVQFYTRVLTSDKNNIKNLVPINNLDETEEEILDRIQADDTYLPPYIKDAAMGNQITKGLFDTNDTKPKASKDPFLQHIAMHINTEFGDLKEHLGYLKNAGLHLIPPAPDLYYELSEIDLGQRIQLIHLFQLVGVEMFSLPGDFFNSLLKPKDASLDRLNEVLAQNNYSQQEHNKVINAYKQIKPILEFLADGTIKNSVSQLESSNFAQQLKTCLEKQKISFKDQDVKQIVDYLVINKKKIQRAKEIGSLIDFQIIHPRSETGYLDQTFTVPLPAQIEGTNSIFLEFIQRTCYDDLPSLMKNKTLSIEDTQDFKSCGAFGQGNFQNLMEGQQKGFEAVQKKRQQQKSVFKLPKIDLDTIKNDPLGHLEPYIKECEKNNRQDKVKEMRKIVNNLKKIIDECNSRKIVV